MDISVTLPGECIADIISLTTPRDACILTAVCPVFKSIADSDSVWEKFLPSDYKEIISHSVSASSLLTSMSKKDLYFHLCYNPILINNGTMSFAIEKENGKKCLMVGARGLTITWGSSPEYWSWISLPESRFPEVAELELVWWFEIIGRIETRILSSNTRYAAYLVFTFVAVAAKCGFRNRPVEFRVNFEGSDNDVETRGALLDPPENEPRLFEDRGDGWMEIEMGEFFNENGDDGTLVCHASQLGGLAKRGIVIQGIEFRPKRD